MKQRYLIAVFFVAVQGPLRGAEEILPASAFAFPALFEGAGARPIGLGSAYVGLAEGSLAMLWNPAALARLAGAELGLHHQVGLLGATQEVLTLAAPYGPQRGLGATVLYEDNGAFEGRDINGNFTGAYSARAYGASLGFGISGAGGLGFGAVAKFQHQELAGTGQTAFAGDLGVQWSKSPALSLGAAYTNLGPDVGGQRLAQGLRAGMASYLGKESDLQWLVVLGGTAVTGGATSLQGGVEHTFKQTLSLRAGYSLALDGSDPAQGWTLGGGVRIESLDVDYAFVPLQKLGNVHRVSVTHQFGARQSRSNGDASAIDREPLLVFSDDDFLPADALGPERLSAAAEARLYQALTQVSAIKGATVRIHGNTSLIAEPLAQGNGPQLRAIGERRSELVRDYLRMKMPRARVSSTVTNGSGKGTPASVFEVVLR